MKYIPLLISAFLSLNVFGESFECKAHPEWPDERSFSGVIEVLENEKSFEATLRSLTLSEPWPLDLVCDYPSIEVSLIGQQENNEVKLGVNGGKECGFVIFLVTSGNKPTMLSPRKSYKVYGEKPYLAECHAI